MLESCGQSYFKWDKTRGCTAKDPATALFQSRCLPGVGKFSHSCGRFRLELSPCGWLASFVQGLHMIDLMSRS